MTRLSDRPSSGPSVMSGSDDNDSVTPRTGHGGAVTRAREETSGEGAQPQRKRASVDPSAATPAQPSTPPSAAPARRKAGLLRLPRHLERLVLSGLDPRGLAGTAGTCRYFRTARPRADGLSAPEHAARAQMIRTVIESGAPPRVFPDATPAFLHQPSELVARARVRAAPPRARDL